MPTCTCLSTVCQYHKTTMYKIVIHAYSSACSAEISVRLHIVALQLRSLATWYMLGVDLNGAMSTRNYLRLALLILLSSLLVAWLCRSYKRCVENCHTCLRIKTPVLQPWPYTLQWKGIAQERLKWADLGDPVALALDNIDNLRSTCRCLR